MAGGGCQLSLERSLYLMTLVFIDVVVSMNLFRYQHVERCRWRSLCAIR
jgi:hypothetical protein